MLLLIVFFAFVTRVYRLHLPEGYIFDEVYHSVTAKLIARNDPWAFEWWNPPPEENTAVDWLHPPLAKYTQAASMLLLGETSFGWRFSSALFGTLVVYLVGYLSLQLTKNHAISLLAALLASLDGLLLTMSRIAMNDIHVTAAILLTLVLYLRTKPFEPNQSVLLPKEHLVTGFAAGLALGTKWSGVFVLGVIFFYELLAVIEKISTLLKQKNKKKIKQQHTWTSIASHVLLVIGAYVLIPASVYILSYGQMFMQGKDFAHFKELHSQIWWYQNNLQATHTYQSVPLEWIINKRPVWFHVGYEEGKRADIYAHGNSIILWAGAGVALLYAVTLLKKMLNANESNSPLLTLIEIARTPSAFVFASYCAMWILWVRSPRIMFFYHYTPALPFLLILLATALVRLYDLPEKYQPLSQAVSITVVLLSILYFIVFLPHWYGIPVSGTFVDSVYFFFDSWR